MLCAKISLTWNEGRRIVSAERLSLIVICVRDFANLLTPVGIVKLFLNYT